MTKRDRERIESQLAIITKSVDLINDQIFVLRETLETIAVNDGADDQQPLPLINKEDHR